MFSTFVEVEVLFCPNFTNLCQHLNTRLAKLFILPIPKSNTMQERVKRNYVPKLGISFNLVNPHKATTSVRVLISNRGRVYRKSIGMSVESSSWINGRCYDRNKNDRLKKIRTALEYELNDNSTEQQIKSALAHIYNGRWNDTPLDDDYKEGVSFYDYFKEWSERPSGAIRQKKNTFKNVFRIMGMCNWGDINERWYTRFILLCDKEGYSRNFTGIMIGRIKTVLHEGKKLGYHNSDFWQEMKKFKEPVENVALTKEECERIMNFETNSSIERKAIDLFTLGYLTCARFSDYSRLTEENIGTDGKIRFAQQKTSRAVVIPCAPRVREILSRNGGRAPVLSQQKFNDAIKELCRDCGICDKCETVSIKGRKRIHEVWEKWELVTSHTFRRSAATNLYLQGIPLRSIQQLTGHSSLESLERYLRVSGEENADRLSGIDFFTK